MLTIQQIIDEADVLVPNSYTPANKVPWLNSINQDFFSVVKIPKIFKLSAVANRQGYIIADDIRNKNIDLVQVGYTQYRSMMEDNVKPTNVYWTFDDDTSELYLSVPPYKTETGVLRYHRISTTNFVSTNLTAKPDAPPEYHWTFVPALCAKIALAQDDPAKAANYEGQYLNAWNAAAQEYAKVVPK